MFYTLSLGFSWSHGGGVCVGGSLAMLPMQQPTHTKNIVEEVFKSLIFAVGRENSSPTECGCGGFPTTLAALLRGNW